MGGTNLVSTMMNTAFDLLLNTCLYIMAIAVFAGAIAGLLQEFGVIGVVNKILSPLMKPLYGLPGAAVVGAIATYFSDNPAILSLAKDKQFARYFKKYQYPALTNLGTCFGMGMIVSAFILGQKPTDGGSVLTAVVIGNIAAALGGVVSCRLMLFQTKRYYGDSANDMEVMDADGKPMDLSVRTIREGSLGQRFLGGFLDGGKSGVEIGLQIIPGVLFICTLLLILIKGPGAEGAYTGAAYEGVEIVPWIGDKLSFILEPLFGFTSGEAVAVPLTALGAAGAAIGLIPSMISEGTIGTNELAVFNGMLMCWSGYLSTHVAMMDSLGRKQLTGKAIISHTIGGFCAGIFAHFIYLGWTAIF
jgi:spore maturation protein SpmB